MCSPLHLAQFILKGRNWRPTATLLASNSNLAWGWTPFLILSLLTQITSALSHPEVTFHEQVSGHQSAHIHQRGTRRLAGRPLPALASVEHTPLYIRPQSQLLQPLSCFSSTRMCQRDCSCSCGLRKSSNRGLIVQILNMEESTVQTSIEKKNFQSILKTVT